MERNANTPAAYCHPFHTFSAMHLLCFNVNELNLLNAKLKVIVHWSIRPQKKQKKKTGFIHFMLKWTDIQKKVSRWIASICCTITNIKNRCANEQRKHIAPHLRHHLRCWGVIIHLLKFITIQQNFPSCEKHKSLAFIGTFNEHASNKTILKKPPYVL